MKNIYFIHIPKAAGISIKETFLKKYCFDNVDLYNIKTNVFDNSSLKQNLRKHIQDKKLHSINIDVDTIIHFDKHKNIYDKIKDITPKFCFSFIRNPWDRFVSIYFYAQQNQYFKSCLTMEDLINLLYNNQDFPEKLQNQIFNTGVSDDLNVKGLQPQFNWISDAQGKLYTDFIGRYENLQNDFNKVCELINIEPMSLAFANTSIHPPFNKCYTKETAKMIGEIYKKDVEEFKYEF